MGGSPSDALANSYGSQLSLNPESAVPPIDYYVAQDDVLNINAFSSIAGGSITVSWRLLLPDGTVKLNQQQLALTANRAKQTTTVQLTEGFLLSIFVINGVALSGNRTYVQIRLRKGSAVFTDEQVLVQGYLSSERFLSWPPGIHENGSDGQGAVISITGTVPGAGAEISETVPTNAMWQLLAFRYSLVTAVAAATRQSDLLMDDGTNTFLENAPASTQAASLTQIYNWQAGIQNAAVANGIIAGPFAQPIYLIAGFRIRTHTFNIQAADQYTAPQYLVKEWLFQ